MQHRTVNRHCVSSRATTRSGGVLDPAFVPHSPLLHPLALAALSVSCSPTRKFTPSPKHPSPQPPGPCSPGAPPRTPRSRAWVAPGRWSRRCPPQTRTSTARAVGGKRALRAGAALVALRWSSTKEEESDSSLCVMYPGVVAVPYALRTGRRDSCRHQPCQPRPFPSCVTRLPTHGTPQLPTPTTTAAVPCVPVSPTGRGCGQPRLSHAHARANPFVPRHEPARVPCIWAPATIPRVHLWTPNTPLP